MKKLIKTLSIVLILLLTYQNTAYAGIKTAQSDDGLIMTYVDPEDGIYIVYGGDKEERLITYNVRSVSGGAITGKMSYPNYDNKRLGSWDLEWLYTPDNLNYKPIHGTAKASVIIIANGTTAEDETSVPSLMSPSVSMEIGTSYAPQIIDKIQDSDYLWTTSNKSVVKINKKTGKMYASSPGVATVTCQINTPYDETYSLTTDVVVMSNSRAARIASNDVVSLKVGEKLKLDPNYNTSTSSAMFSSSKASIAKVDPYSGTVTAKKAGETYITCIIIDTNYEIRTIQYSVVVTE